MTENNNPVDPNEEEEPIIGDAPPQSHTLFSNKVYDVLKWVARVVLPAMALFYIAVAPLWGLPKQEEVAGTIVALDLMLGTLLGISNKQYMNSDARFDGEVHVQRIPGTDESQVGFAIDSSSVVGKDELVLKVQK